MRGLKLRLGKIQKFSATPRSLGRHYGMEHRNNLSIRDLAAHERPQERLENAGARSLSDIELIAVVLRKGTREVDVLNLATRVLKEAGSLARLLRMDLKDLQRFPGIGRVKAVQLSAIIEIARRIAEEQAGQLPLVESPDSVWRLLRGSVAGLDVEKFFVLALNRKNRVLGSFEVTSGTATASLVHPREVFREAIRLSAAAIVCAHNHPSGDPTPSRADITITRQLHEASKVVDIALLDHIILGEVQHSPTGMAYYSFADAGLL